MKVFNKNTYLPFLFSFFNDFLFYYSFYITFFSKNGFSGGNLALLLIVMNISKMMADIPVGLLSDRISRRNILIIGLLCRFLFCILCLSYCNFLSFVVAMIFVGIGNSCLWTHTWNYFYDYLKEKRSEKIFSRFMGTFYAISNIAIAFAAFSGEKIYSNYSFNGVFVGSIVSLIISCIIMINLPNYKPKKTLKTATNIKISNPLHFIALLNALLKKPQMIRMLLFTILMDTMFIVFLDMNTTIMNNAGMNAENISKIVGCVAFIRIFSNYFSGFTEKLMSFKKMNSLLLVLICVSICISCINSQWMILSVSLYLCIYPFFDTSIKTKIEHRIDSNTRATILSLASLFVSIFAIIFNLIIGIVAEQSGYFASPICIFLIILIILFIIRNITKFYRIDLFIRRFFAKLASK